MNNDKINVLAREDPPTILNLNNNNPTHSKGKTDTLYYNGESMTFLFDDQELDPPLYLDEINDCNSEEESEEKPSDLECFLVSLLTLALIILCL